MSCKYSNINQYGRLMCMVEEDSPRLCPFQRYCGKTFSWELTPESYYCTKAQEADLSKAKNKCANNQLDTDNNTCEEISKNKHKKKESSNYNKKQSKK